MKSRKTTRQLIALAGATALGAGALLSFSPAALAAPQSYGNVDTAQPASITVHKFLNQATPITGDLSQAPAAGTFADPVAGVEFTVYPLLRAGLAVDLSDPAAWESLAALTPGAACTAPTGYTLGAGTAMPLTVSDGSSTLSLPVGLYQVCETAAPSHIIETAQPFVLTLPTPHQNGWVYDVHAYPKNGAGSITKTIAPQQDLGLGAVVRFPTTVPVPRMAQAWTGFGIRDTLDARLTPVSLADVSVTVDGVAMDPTFYTVSVSGQTLSFELTSTGVAWLNEGPNAHVGKNIEVTFAGTVTEIGGGSITNTAQFWPNNPGFDPSGEPPLPSNEVSTHWGNLELVKRAAGSTGASGTLGGAVFEIYNSSAPYAADCSASVATGQPIAVGGTATFTSNAAGVISLDGLFVSDSVNPAIDNPHRCYVLKEVTAPAGYVLPSDPYTPVTILIGATTTDNVEISNTQQGVPELPLTGAAGQILLITGGLATVAVAVGLVMVRRRREAAVR